MNQTSNDLQMWMFLPNYVNPYECNYINYSDHIRIFNTILQRRIANILDCFIDRRELLTYATTGSDGRLEKGPQSKVELIILKDGNHLNVDAITKVKSEITSIPLSYVFGNIEVKDLEAEVMSYFHNNPKIVYPNRIFDIQYLNGDVRLVQKAYHMVHRELTGDLSSRIIFYVKNNRRIARQIMEKGLETFKGREIKHFDIESGIAFYNPNYVGGSAGSFKYGPLRFVQFKFAEDLADYLKNKKYGIILSLLPTNTVERFLTLESESMTTLSHPEIADIVDSYKYFLWLYHLSQFNFRQNNPETLFDKVQVRERISSLKEILSKKRIFK